MLSSEVTLEAGLRFIGAGISIIPVFVQTGRTARGLAQPKRPHRDALIETGHCEWVWSERRQRKEQVAKWVRFQEVRADEALVREWVRLGVRGWGLVTGQLSGLVAIDFDEAGQSLFAELGWQAHTLTPSGGQHVYVRHPGWRVTTAKSEKKGMTSDEALLKLPPGVDVRGDGGYVVAPPTITDAGAYSRSQRRTFLSRLEIPEVVSHLGQSYLFRAALTLDQDPEELRLQRQKQLEQEAKVRVNLIVGSSGLNPETAFQGRAASLNRIMERAISLGQTGRNDGAFYLGCQLRDNGYAAEEALQLFDG